MGSTPSHAHYEEMKDTPWITQARDIAKRGGQGILDNYNNVNVFDDATKKSIEARNNEIYKRAFDNMSREYTNTMNKYNAANYGRFGTLNATAPYYVTDQYQRDFQRQMNDLAYNQAINYDDLFDKELQRRYNTLNMFSNMYGYGTVPYQQDVNNWNTRNTNKDIDYLNAMTNYQNSFGNRIANIGYSTLASFGNSLGEGYGKLLSGQSNNNAPINAIGGVQ